MEIYGLSLINYVSKKLSKYIWDFLPSLNIYLHIYYFKRKKINWLNQSEPESHSGALYLLESNMNH